MNRLKFLTIAFALMGSFPIESALFSQEVAFVSDNAGIAKIITPFLTEHCLRCHGPELQEADFRVDTDLPNDFVDLRAKEHWSEVVDVLNSHEMPPEDEPQPEFDATAEVVDWITQQMARAELLRRDSRIVLRRLNRNEYRNTVRDLIGVDFDISTFPEDPLADGFDNNGAALTISPLLMELYFDAARRILDRALVTGEQPPVLKWRFQPESGNSDSNRVRYDGQNLIVNGGKDRVEGDYKVLHHASWDRNIDVRDFAVLHEGEYIIRIQAYGRIPSRDEVVQTGTTFLQRRLDEQMQKNAKGEKYHREAFERGLEHLQQDRIYDYGPPRLKLIQNLGGQPRVLTEFDVEGDRDQPKTIEIHTRFTTERAGIKLEYGYQIPAVLENFWFQTGDEFARPELWVDWIELEGPVNTSWPPESHKRILFDSPLQQQDESAYAREVIARFMKRAYRREVTQAEIDSKSVFYEAARAESESFVEAIKPSLIAILVSPNFLYLAEPAAVQSETANAEKPAAALREFTDVAGNKMRARILNVAADDLTIEREDGRTFTVPMDRFSPADQEFISQAGGRNADRSHTRPLNDYEIASRLSYFLWSSMPDDELFELAAKQQLHDPAVLAAQVDRLLADPKSDSFVEDFSSLWLGLREVGANPPAQDLYPEYDRHLEASIILESQSFFAEILRNDLSLMNFVKSDFVVINERLARFYGIDDVRGDHFRKVAVPDGVHRGGVVTQASMLSITSNGTRTSPVKRGTWILKNVLGIDPGLPVANAGDIAPKVPGIDKATVRRRLEIHRELPQCARCHNKIDPLGFALENYNAAGAWREQEGFGYKGRIEKNDPVIDASGKLPDGTAFTGVTEMQDALLKKDELFLKSLSGKMLTYALGRELGVADAIHIDAAVAELRQSDDTLRQLIKFIVTSQPFLAK